jgi:FAD dependent oxidoreductase TIGR03364
MAGSSVVIVGGGVLGTMHALMARRRGWAVVQLERDAAPRRASVRNFGLVWVSGRAAGDELKVALRARELWEGIGAEVPEVGFRADGSLTVALDEAELDVMQEAAGQPDAADRGFELLGPFEVRRRNPVVRGDVLGGLYCSKDGVVEPGRVLPALRAHMEAEGGYVFLPGREVVHASDGLAVDHTGARHEADVVLLCTGDAHTGVAAPHLVDAPLRRCRLQMLQTAALHERLPTALADGDSLRYYPAFRLPSLDALPPQTEIAARFHLQLLLVQRADGGLTIGDTHAYDEPFDFALESAPYDHVIARAERILGRPLPAIERRWAGVYSQCTDERVCYRGGEDGVIVVTGPGGRGMTLSPAIAEQTFESLS